MGGYQAKHRPLDQKTLHSNVLIVIVIPVPFATIIVIVLIVIVIINQTNH